MKHVFAVVLTPPSMNILQVACSMDEDDGRSTTTFPVRRHVHATVDSRSVACLETHNARVNPVVSEKLWNWGCCHWLAIGRRAFVSGLVRKEVQLRRHVAVRAHV